MSSKTSEPEMRSSIEIVKCSTYLHSTVVEDPLLQWPSGMAVQGVLVDFLDVGLLLGLLGSRNATGHTLTYSIRLLYVRDQGLGC